MTRGCSESLPNQLSRGGYDKWDKFGNVQRPISHRKVATTRRMAAFRTN